MLHGQVRANLLSAVCINTSQQIITHIECFSDSLCLEGFQESLNCLIVGAVHFQWSCPPSINYIVWGILLGVPVHGASRYWPNSDHVYSRAEY